MGNYSVKTAYVMIQETKRIASTRADSKAWKRLWTLKIPPKVKHLIWRAVTGCLPTKIQLKQKHVDLNVACPLCNLEPETIEHALLNCSFASECWTKLRGSPSYHESFPEWFADVFDSWDTATRQSAAMMCWALWKCKNDLVWNQKSAGVVEVVTLSRVVLSQWIYAQDRTFDPFLGHMTAEDGDEQWTKPGANMIKVNCDAAIFNATNCYSTAFAVRDHRGEVIEARSKCCLGNMAPENAEAIGLREVLSWIKQRQEQNVWVETDCLVVVQAVRSTADLRSYFDRLIKECKALLSELQGRNVNVKFVKRSTNKVAHFLAKSTYCIADRIWRVCDNHPEFIDVLMNDLRNE